MKYIVHYLSIYIRGKQSDNSQSSQRTCRKIIGATAQRKWRAIDYRGFDDRVVYWTLPIVPFHSSRLQLSCNCVSSYLLGLEQRYTLRFATVSNSYIRARHYIQSISKVLIGSAAEKLARERPMRDFARVLHYILCIRTQKRYIHHAGEGDVCGDWETCGVEIPPPRTIICPHHSAGARPGLSLRRILVLNLITAIKAAFHPSSPSLSA